MATTTQEQRRDMVQQKFTEYRTAVMDGLNEVEAALERGEYATACNMMAKITQHQASASMSMRNILIKFGFLARERGDD